MPRHPDAWWASKDYASAQTDATVKAAPSANLRYVITWLTISNGAVAGNITLLDGAGGAVLFELYAPINGGVAKSGINIPLTKETLLALTSTDVTTHAINVGGYVESI